MADIRVNTAELSTAASREMCLSTDTSALGTAVAGHASSAAAACRGDLADALDGFGGRWTKGLGNLEQVADHVAANLSAAAAAYSTTELGNVRGFGG